MWALVILNTSGIVQSVMVFSTQALANAALAMFQAMAGNAQHPRGWTAQVITCVATDTVWAHKWK